MLKVILTSDWHVGDFRNGPSVHGINGRFADIVRLMGQMVTYAIKHDIHYIIMAGDVYRDRNPTDAHRLAIAEIMHRCHANSITLFIVVGNHDLPKIISGIHTLSPFKPVLPNNIYIIDEPTQQTIDGHKFFMVPFSGPPQAPGLSQAISDSNDNDILVMHGTIEGCVAGIYEYEISDDDIIPMSMIKHFKAVLAGDIHKAQHFENVWYPGSLERLTFNDENDTKGFYVMSIDAEVKGEFVPTQARKMLTLRANQISTVDKDTVFDAIVRVIGAKIEDLPDIKETLTKHGCYYIAGIRAENTETRAAPDATFDVTTMVAKYAKKKKYQGDVQSAIRLFVETLDSVA